jgi:hypothetical protein
MVSAVTAQGKLRFATYTGGFTAATLNPDEWVWRVRHERGKEPDVGRAS